MRLWSPCLQNSRAKKPSGTVPALPVDEQITWNFNVQFGNHSWLSTPRVQTAHGVRCREPSTVNPHPQGSKDQSLGSGTGFVCGLGSPAGALSSPAAFPFPQFLAEATGAISGCRCWNAGSAGRVQFLLTHI